MRQRGERPASEGGSHEIGKEVEGIDSLHLAGSGDRGEALDVAFAPLGLGAEAEFAHLHERPKRSFSSVVGRLDSLNGEKGKK